MCKSILLLWQVEHVGENGVIVFREDGVRW